MSPGHVTTLAGWGSAGWDKCMGREREGLPTMGWYFLILYFRALNSPRMGAWASTPHLGVGRSPSWSSPACDTLGFLCPLAFACTQHDPHTFLLAVFVPPLLWHQFSAILPCTPATEEELGGGQQVCNTDPLLACYPPRSPATPQILPIYSYTLSIALLYSPSCPTSHSKERREATLTAPVYKVLYPPSPPCTHRSQAADDKVGGKHSNSLGSYRNPNIE